MCRWRSRRSDMDRDCITTETIDNVLVVYFNANAIDVNVFNELNSVLDNIDDTI